MNVLLISASYRPVLGGLQTVVHQLAMGLQQHGDAVQVVTNRYPTNLPAYEIIDGVRVNRYLFLPSSREALRSGRVDVAMASACIGPVTRARLASLVAEFQPDIINLHFPEPRLKPVLNVSKKAGVPLVVSLHGDDVDRWFDPDTESPKDRSTTAQTSIHEFLREADTVTACSHFLLQRAITLEPTVSEKGIVTHNSVDLHRFSDASAHAHPRPYVLAYGRHAKKKGFDLLLKAFATVAAQHPEMDLLMAGKGDQTLALQQLRDSLGLSQRAILLGPATPERVVQLLNGCCLAVIPSRQEPFGIVVLEAIASGKPIVATRVGGLPEVVQAVIDRTDVRPFVEWADPNPENLALAMMRVLTKERSHHTSPLRSLSGFSQRDMVDRYRGAFEAALRPSESLSPEFHVSVS
jgi:glycosyltransferase involved in cell wall biosynthesis